MFTYNWLCFIFLAVKSGGYYMFEDVDSEVVDLNQKFRESLIPDPEGREMRNLAKSKGFTAVRAFIHFLWRFKLFLVVLFQNIPRRKWCLTNSSRAKRNNRRCWRIESWFCYSFGWTTQIWSRHVQSNNYYLITIHIYRSFNFKAVFFEKQNRSTERSSRRRTTGTELRWRRSSNQQWNLYGKIQEIV